MHEMPDDACDDGGKGDLADAEWDGDETGDDWHVGWLIAVYLIV